MRKRIKNVHSENQKVSKDSKILKETKVNKLKPSFSSHTNSIEIFKNPKEKTHISIKSQTFRKKNSEYFAPKSKKIEKLMTTIHETNIKKVKLFNQLTSLEIFQPFIFKI